MKKDIYRCSCCNELKNEKTNIRYIPYEAFESVENASIYGICIKCHNKIKKQGIDRLEIYNKRIRG
jgi:hypothetical protein